MKKYRVHPYRLYDGASKEIVHFDEEALLLTELTPLHKKILLDFSDQRTRSEVLDLNAGVLGVKQAINELIELKLIDCSMPSVRCSLSKDLRPEIAAFRVVLTEQCNLCCAECFVTKQRSRLRTMSRGTLCDTVKETIPYGANKRLVYHFFGGEPLICIDHIKQAVKIIRKAVRDKLMVRPIFAITTNLTLLNDETVSFFKENDFKVGVSIDGPEKINDQLRIYRNGMGTFRDVYQNYQKLLEAKIDCHILVTPHASHLAELPEIFRKILTKFRMKTVTVNTPLNFKTVRWTMPGERYAHVLIQLHRIAREFGVNIDSAASPPLVALALWTRREGPCSIVCNKTMVSIGPDGSVSYCAQKWHHSLSVPNVPSCSALKIPVRRESRCLTCEARNICGGPCPAYQQIAHRRIDKNKCAFMRALLKEIAANLDLFEEVES